MAGEGLRAVFYARVSTEEEQQLNAIEKQIEENCDIIRNKKWILADRYIDKGISGTQAKKRNEYMRLLEDIKKDKFDIIVVKDQSRLQRNTMDWYVFLNEILQHDKKLFLYLENTFFHPDDKFLYGIKAMMAEEYSRDLSKKGNASKRRRQEKGKPIITNRTWGFQNRKGEIVIDETEAEMIKKIYQMFAEGYGGRVVARVLREDGIRNRNGKTLSENTIRDIVKNPLYKGIVVMNREHFDFESKKTIKNPESEWIYREGLVPQIIGDELWEQANKQLNRRKTVDRKHNVGINTGNTLLSSKIICGECGSKYWRNKRQRGIYWYCSEGARSGRAIVTGKAIETSPKIRVKQKAATENTGSKCTALNLKEDEIMSLLEQMGKRLMEEEKREKVLDHALHKIAAALTDESSSGTIEAIQEKKEKLNGKKDALLDLLLDGTITKSNYSAKIQSIEEQIVVLDKNEVVLSAGSKNKEKLLERLNKVRELFDNHVERGIEVPIMCSHLEQIKVYEDRLDIYLDFLKSKEFLTSAYHAENKCYGMPAWLGGKLPG